MIDLPMKAFCLMGNKNYEKIEIIINELFGPSPDSGYDFKGDLIIHVGCFKIHNINDYYSSTGAIYSFCDFLIKCYDSLKGTAKYSPMFEQHLLFELTMTKMGHATIEGEYEEYHHLRNKLIFEMETDQSCIKNTITHIKQVQNLFNN